MSATRFPFGFADFGLAAIRLGVIRSADFSAPAFARFATFVFLHPGHATEMGARYMMTHIVHDVRGAERLGVEVIRPRAFLDLVREQL